MNIKDPSKWMFRRKVPLKGDSGDPGSPGPIGPIGNVGPIGPAGTVGQRGSLWSASAGAPVGTALVGDFHLDTSTGDVWAFT